MAKTRRNQPERRAVAGQRTTGAPPAAPATPVAAEPPRPTIDPRAAERIERQRQRAALAQQQEQLRRMRAIALSLGAFLIVGIGLFWAINSQRPQPGRAIPIVSWEHIEEGAKGVDHNSTPPTSGQHYANPAPVGFYDRPIPNEVQVHNLEHGQIMIQYTCTDCPELPERLRPFTQRYPKWVLVAPYPDPEGKVGARIALTAWGRIDTFDEFDEQRITAFIEAFKNKGREVVMTD